MGGENRTGIEPVLFWGEIEQNNICSIFLEIEQEKTHSAEQNSYFSH